MELVLLPRNGICEYKMWSFLAWEKICIIHFEKIKMNNFNHAITPMETCIKLKNDTNDELEDATLYKKIIDLLRYLCNTRRDICQIVDLVSWFMEKSRSGHLVATKILLRYIRDTIYLDVFMSN